MDFRPTTPTSCSVRGSIVVGPSPLLNAVTVADATQNPETTKPIFYRRTPHQNDRPPEEPQKKSQR